MLIAQLIFLIAR